MFSFDVGLFLGLIGIALAIFFGLRGFYADLLKSIQEIKDILLKSIQETRDILIKIGQRVDDIWGLLVHRASAPPSTIIREYKNLGKVKISVYFGEGEVQYLLETEKPVLRADLIDFLSKRTGFEDEEKNIFGGKVLRVTDISPLKVMFYLPSTEAKICTQYMTRLLEWLDSIYYIEAEKLKAEYEEPI